MNNNYYMNLVNMNNCSWLKLFHYFYASVGQKIIANILVLYINFQNKWQMLLSTFCFSAGEKLYLTVTLKLWYKGKHWLEALSCPLNLTMSLMTVYRYFHCNVIKFSRHYSTSWLREEDCDSVSDLVWESVGAFLEILFPPTTVNKSGQKNVSFSCSTCK